MEILEGTPLANKIKNEIKDFIKETKVKAKLSVILVGDDMASKIYVNTKTKALDYCNLEKDIHFLPKKTTEKELLNLVEELNTDNSVSAILVQLPLPDHIDTIKILSKIKEEKDADGFGITSMGKLSIGRSNIIPCTPKGILTLLEYYKIDTKSKNCVVIGRSTIVGRPISILLSQEPYNATVTSCHSKTTNLKDFTKNADIIITAVGQANLINSSMCKNDVVIIDVGMNRIKDDTKKKGYRLVGDVNFESFRDTDAKITPVPKGVGPLTIASLMQNTVLCELGRKVSEK